MATTRLTKLRYETYLHKAHRILKLPTKNKKFRPLLCDILYTFLDYYQHLGNTPIHKHRGQTDILILQQFQSVYKKYNLNKSLTSLSTKTLLKALSASLTTMTIWYYAIEDLLNIRIVNFKQLKSQKDIIHKIHNVEHIIKHNHEKVIQFSLSKYQALFITVINKKKGTKR